MVPQSRRPVWACAQHVRQLGLCVGVLFWFAAPTLGDVINSYTSWQRNGFSSSASAASSSTSFSTTTLSATVDSSVSVFSTTTVRASGAVFGSGDGTLAGLVYYDGNGSDTADNSDWALPGAKVTLSMVGSDTVISMYTGTDGSYTFTDLPSGTYTIALVLSDSDPGTNTLGTLLDSSGEVVETGQGTVGTDQFTGIVLGSGYSGENYNFSQLSYPASLVTKRLLTTIDPGMHHINVTPSPVPEPGTVTLLAIAGLCLGGALWRRRRG